MRKTVRMLLLTGLAFGLAWASGAEPPPCTDARDVEAVLNCFPAGIPAGPGVHFEMSFVPALKAGYAMSAHGGWAGYRASVAASLPATDSVLVQVLKVGGDTTLQFWRPATRTYGMREIWGGNAFRVSDAAEIVYVSRPQESKPYQMTIWIWTRGPLGEESSAELAHKVLSRFALKSGTIHVGDSPAMWTHGDFPLFVPALAHYGVERLRSAQPPTAYRCQVAGGTLAGRCVLMPPVD